MYLTDQLTQLFPPKPGFTEKGVPSLQGKVYVVTGASAGIGKLLARILYEKGAKVYIAARSPDKIDRTIAEIRDAAHASTVGELVALSVDLADLRSVKAAAENFLQREQKLNVLFNNAGVMLPPEGSKTAQGYELQLGVNCVGPYLFTKLLTPILVKTAKTESPGTTRVVWVSSTAIEASYGLAGGIDLENLDYHKELSKWTTYAVSKSGVFFYGTELARRLKADGVISIPLHPGIVDSDLWRWQGKWANAIFKRLLFYPTILGTYTLLFAGLSPSVAMEKSGQWVIPWGRFQNVRPDLEKASKPVGESGGTGIGMGFWNWSDEQVKSYI